jgi:ABC-type glycerol-3-phosphate transport system substrate-binding protein
MKKIFALVLPLTVALAASFGCASANAAQTNVNKPPVAETAFQATQTPHSLTRRDVYNQLVNAEKNGSLSRLDATIYSGA